MPQGMPPLEFRAAVATASVAPASPPDAFHDALTRRLYFQGLGIVCTIAFVSLWVQIHGLIGEHGLLPIARYWKLASDKLGSDAYFQLPSLLWFGASDAMLHVWCGLGTLLSISLVIGWAPRIVLLLLWAIYLSLTVAGQTFLSFQWDSLLLEMIVCSVLYAPRGLLPVWRSSPSSLPAARWLLWALAFKLMFLSGVTKLLSGDSSWSDGTALQFHYYTQPIPNWISWYASQLPLAIHKLSLQVMFIVEVLCPFLVLAGGRGRCAFGLATMLLMVVIELTGNYGFFNLQTVVLCIPLLNDRILRWCLLRRMAAEFGNVPPANRSLARTICGNSIATVMLAVSLLMTVREMVRTQQGKLPGTVVATLSTADKLLLSWSEPTVLKFVAPYRSINGYGLFRVMTTHRPEIIVEISDDGQQWSACEFPYKVGRVDRAPPIVAPHMPRLDWQMWFAALNPHGSSYWLKSLTDRILEGNATTARLLGQPDLAVHPPRFVRLAYYEYKFSSPDQKQNTGAWWSRSFSGNLTGSQSRE